MIEICLRQRATSEITERNFIVRDCHALDVGNGWVVTKTTHISHDPYLALRMRKEIPDGGRAAPFPIVGRTIGVVIDPGVSDFSVGEVVLGFGRWSTFDARPAQDLRRIELDDIPVAAHLGALGHSGFTAWLGIHLARPQRGETLVISAAAGAVGSVAGQLAKQAGCRVIGIAGGPEKVKWTVDTLGFDTCLDHRNPNLGADLRILAPNGINLHFESVGTKTLDPVLANMKPGGRIMLCGLIQHYQDNAPISLQNFRALLENRVRLEPFSIYDHEGLAEQGRRELLSAVRTGQLHFAVTMTNGIEAVPAAFVAMLNGRGMGKHITEVV